MASDLYPFCKKRQKKFFYSSFSTKNLWYNAFKIKKWRLFMQITDFSPSLARVRTISDTAVATAPASASDENISLDNAAEEQ